MFLPDYLGQGPGGPSHQGRSHGGKVRQGKEELYVPERLTQCVRMAAVWVEMCAQHGTTERKEGAGLL